MTKKTNNFITKIVLLSLGLLLITILPLHGINAQNVAIVKIQPDKKELSANDITTVKITVNSMGETINGIEGEFVYDANILNVEKIQIGDSFISLWVEKPIVKKPGSINFSGIIPGGIVLTDNEIFSIVFRAKTNGESNFNINNLQLLINDGEGTILNSKVEQSKIAVTGEPLKLPTELQNLDTQKPIKFVIKRTRDEALFNNKWFIVFNTQDKESGISHYKVCEGFKKNCIDANSPHELQNQSPFYYIKVIAFDVDGNSQKSTLISPYYYAIDLIIIILVIIFILKYLKKQR